MPRVNTSSRAAAAACRPLPLPLLLGVVAAAALLLPVARAMEPELQCSACEAVASELAARLASEAPRATLDMRHRIDKDGVRYGKVLDYRVSEIRAVELLEDLCDAMSDYTVIEKSDSSSSSTEGAAAGALSAGAAAPAAVQRVWVKHRGEGSVHVPASKRPPKPEEEARAKQLKAACGLLLERHEEDVVEALMADGGFAGGVGPVLCQEIAKRCPAGHVFGGAAAADASTGSSS